MGTYFNDCLSGRRHVFTVAAGAAVGSYWPPSGDVDRRSMVYRHLLATLLAQTIEQFTLLRFLQGISLCFIGAVGYAAIQESFLRRRCVSKSPP